MSYLELYIKQRVFSIGDKYDVYDEMQQSVYHVEGEIFTWGAKIHLLDLTGRELFFIRRKVFTFLPEYEIFQGETLYARIKREFKFLRPKLTVESSLGSLEISGEVFNMDYYISLNGNTMGELHKKWLSWGDTYFLSVYDPKDAPFFTALAIAVDNCLHNDRDHH